MENAEQEKFRDRLLAVARKLMINEGPRGLAIEHGTGAKWWITGGKGGDVAIPESSWCSTRGEALDAMESFLDDCDRRRR